MNSEIKFRAVCSADNCDRKMIYFGMQQFDDGVAAWPSPNDINHINEYHSPLMQYAGLKDKNGKDVFVGDIFSEKWKVEVYQNKEGTYMARFHTNPAANKPRSLLKFLESREKAGTSDRDCLVIGNIYETPELI